MLNNRSIHRVGVVILVTLLAPPFGNRRLAAQELTETGIQELTSLLAEKQARTPTERKLDTSLLFALRQSKGEAAVPGFRALPRVAARASVDGQGMVIVDIKADVGDALLQTIDGIGGLVVSSYPDYDAVRARVPIRRIEELAALPEVRFVGPRQQYLVHTGSATSQGDTAHAAAAARTAFSVNGTGVKVGVISNGVDTLAQRQATGDLPAGVTVVPGQAGSGDEGTAMLEIVHDLAPGAQLFFATADPTPSTFASNIQTLRTTYGCDVIIDDVTYFNEGAFQDGPIAQAVNSVVAQGALFFSSAGNLGNKNKGTSGTWEGDFVNSLTTIPIFTGSAWQGRPIHSFNGLTGASAANSNQLTGTAPVAITLKWSDPLGGSSNDYDIFRMNSTLTAVFDLSDDFQTGTQDPYEQMGGANSLERVVVVLYSGVGRALRLDTLTGRLSTSSARATFGHNAGASTISVGATDVRPVGGGAFTGGAANPVETYSSDGPRRMFYNASGTAITPGNVLFGTFGGQELLKPDITAADCGITTTPGFSPFCGTSAAAPHAGAIAALLLSVSTNPSGGQAQAAMYTTALNIEAVGVDRDSGVGIVMADAAVGALANNPSNNFFTVSPCRLVDTRNPAGPVGGPALTCGSDRTFTLAGQCDIPSGAKAVSLNATVTSTSGGGNLRLFAGGAPAPTASSLNWSAGQTRGNNAIIQINASGQLAARCAPSGTTHLILDVNGYFFTAP